MVIVGPPLKVVIVRILMTEKIRPYAVCRTPDWLKEIERRGLPPIEKVRKDGTERFHKSGMKRQTDNHVR